MVLSLCRALRLKLEITILNALFLQSLTAAVISSQRPCHTEPDLLKNAACTKRGAPALFFPATPTALQSGTVFLLTILNFNLLIRVIKEACAQSRILFKTCLSLPTILLIARARSLALAPAGLHRGWRELPPSPLRGAAGCCVPGGTLRVGAGLGGWGAGSSSKSVPCRVSGSGALRAPAHTRRMSRRAGRRWLHGWHLKAGGVHGPRQGPGGQLSLD